MKHGQWLRLAVALLISAGFCRFGASAQNAGTRGDFRVALSVSPFTESEFTSGIVFRDGKRLAQTTEELQRMYVAHGATEVYARIATTRIRNPGNGDHGLDRGLERAVLAKVLGLPFNPELGLWNAYGDVMCQPSPNFRDLPQLKVPGEWTSLSLDQMLPVLKEYGAIVAREIAGTGARVNVWDIGNEVDLGIAGVAIRPFTPQDCASTEGGPGWYKAPDAVDPEIGRMSRAKLLAMPVSDRIAWLRAHLWNYQGRMMAAVADGIRSVDPDAKFSTHTTTSLSNTAVNVAFYKAMREAGFDVDQIGLSYYPTISQNSLPVLKETAATLQRELGRRVFIAEYGFPAAHIAGQFAWNAPQEGYQQTDAGQAAFTRDLTAWGVRSGVLSGIRPWAPDFTDPVWSSMALFELAGKTANARPALNAIAEGLRKAKLRH